MGFRNFTAPCVRLARFRRAKTGRRAEPCAWHRGVVLAIFSVEATNFSPFSASLNGGHGFGPKWTQLAARRVLRSRVALRKMMARVIRFFGGVYVATSSRVADEASAYTPLGSISQRSLTCHKIYITNQSTLLEHLEGPNA